MQKQQYILFLTRDDGATRSTRFCATSLRLLIFLCIAIPAIAIIATYEVLQSWQNITILTHKNELLKQEMQVYQHELQKYATIQQLVTSYEKEATPILVASKAVPAPVPYAIEENDETVENAPSSNPNTSENSDVAGSVDMVATSNESDAATDEAQDTVMQAQQPDIDSSTKNVSPNINTDVTSNVETPQPPLNNADAEHILSLQTKPQNTNQNSFTVTNNKAKLTGVTISESKNNVRTAFQLVNATDTPIAGHIYISIQDHDKKLHPIQISEKLTAFRILRYRDYDLEFALPQNCSAADVDKIVITAKTRDGEVFYCNGFSLE